MKHFHNLGKIQETEGDIIEIENFVSDKELSELNNYTASNKNRWINRDDGQKYCFNFKNSSPVCDISLWNDLFIQILLPKLKKIFKNINFYVDKDEFPPHIFRSYYPLKVHVDTGKDNSDKIIYKQILIPLKTYHAAYRLNMYHYSIAPVCTLHDTFIIRKSNELGNIIHWNLPLR